MPPSSDETFLSRLCRADPDRHFATLFAPARARENLALLYLFNHELARAREVASNQMLALIRLQWWREVVQGQPRERKSQIESKGQKNTEAEVGQVVIERDALGETRAKNNAGAKKRHSDVVAQPYRKTFRKRPRHSGREAYHHDFQV